MQKSIPTKSEDPNLNQARVEYEHEKNPFAAWLGYVTARRLREPVPEWVQQYLDQAGRRILTLLPKAIDGKRVDHNRRFQDFACS